jgi:hypothetical protein
MWLASDRTESGWPVQGQRIRGGQLWTPAELAGLSLWLRADSLSLSDNDAVAQWDDDSDKGNDAKQATADYRPKYKINIVNGKPAVLFDGGNDFLEFSSAIAPLIGACTIIGACAMGDVAAAWTTLLGHGPASATDYAQLGTNGSGYLNWRRKNAASGPQVTGDADVSDGAWRIWTATGNANGSIARTGINGGTYGSDAATAAFTGTRSLLGVSIYSGGLEQYWNGSIAEMIIYDSVLANADRQRTEGYLAHKWGLTAGLPGDHPYKTLPPRVPAVIA